MTNSIFFYISLLPLFAIVIGLAFKQPTTIQFNRIYGKNSCYVGETIEIAFHVTINQGIGTLILRDLIPEHFELIEGSNFKIIWKGLKPHKETIRYSVRCTKRGTYNLENLNWEFRHIMGLKQTKTGIHQEKLTLDVKIRTLSLRKIRNIKTTTKLPLPMGAMSKAGLLTTDFKEIREYAYGDSYKKINWKTTARLSSGSKTKPFVNEFEREGKKFVWILIDSSPQMGSHGTVINNTFEHALAAADNLSQYYLERDCFVGVYLYNENHKLLYPDVGRRQRFKISRELLHAEMAKEESLRESVQRCKPYLTGTNPLCIVITTLNRQGKNDIIEGAKELAKYNRRLTKRNVALLIVNIVSYHFAATNPQANMSADILQTKSYPTRIHLRKTGAIVVDWNPLEQPLAKVLLKEVGRR
jgi:uncharacterized protein (DUF58 family)